MKLAITLLWAGALAAQDFSNLQIEKIAAGYEFTEGPAWSRDGYLLFADIPSNRVLKFIPAKGITVEKENSEGASGHAFDAQGRLYSCESHSRRVVRNGKKGMEVLAERFEGKRLNAPNDVVVRRDGQVYFTDPAFGKQADARELDFYGVYHITPKGILEVVAKPAGRPNGIALSPDGKTLYVVNSDERNIRAYNLDHAGAASNERIVISGIAGVPDGVRTDEKGNLYVAAKALYVYSADGTLLTTMATAETPSNCAFGDGDLQGLYITARTSVYHVRLNVKGALPY